MRGTGRASRGRVSGGWAVGLIVLLLAGWTSAAVINDVTVTVLPRPTTFGSGETYHGYMEYRVALTNRSPGGEKRVTLRLPAESWAGGRDEHLRQVSREVTLAPGASATVSLLQPPITMRGDALEVNVDGQVQQVALALTGHASDFASHGTVPLAMLASQAIDNTLRTELLNEMAARGAGGPATIHQAVSPIDQWSSDWLNYTRYDGVVLDAKDLEAAPIDVVDALRRYTSAGGTLLVVGGAWQPPADWRPRSDAQPGITVDHCGFGVVLNPDTSRPGLLPFKAVLDQVDRTAMPFRNNYSVEDANSHFPVVEDLQVPVKGLLVLMIGFAVVIGPVNLWVLGRYKRRMWLLWTVPAFSLLTCLAVWIYATAAEGWSGHERTRTLTLLDQDNLTATTLGWAAFYAPITPGGGLRYEMNSELTPQIGRYASYYYYGSRSGGRARTLDLSEGQHLASGWIVARVPVHLQIRKTATTVRQRLNFRETGGRIEVVNGLGAPIKWLRFADDRGRLHSAGAIPVGQSATMVADSQTVSENADALRQVYPMDWVGGGGMIDRIIGMPEAFLVPGSYIAVLESDPFLESGLDKAGERRSEAAVIGYASVNAAGPGAPPAGEAQP